MWKKGVSSSTVLCIRGPDWMALELTLLMRDPLPGRCYAGANGHKQTTGAVIPEIMTSVIVEITHVSNTLVQKSEER